MSEEEASVGVVWISIGVSPFVMASVITRPFNNMVLEAHAIAHEQEGLEWKTSLEASVRPKTMSACRDSQTSHYVAKERPQNSWPSSNKNDLVETDESTKMESSEDDYVAPNNLGLELVLFCIFLKTDNFIQFGSQVLIFNDVVNYVGIDLSNGQVVVGHL